MADVTNSVEELAFRESDGISVSLLWTRNTRLARVAVHDSKLGTSFELTVREDQSPMDVFNHPYAYAASYGKLYPVSTSTT